MEKGKLECKNVTPEIREIIIQAIEENFIKFDDTYTLGDGFKTKFYANLRAVPTKKYQKNNNLFNKITTQLTKKLIQAQKEEKIYFDYVCNVPSGVDPYVFNVFTCYNNISPNHQLASLKADKKIITNFYNNNIQTKKGYGIQSQAGFTGEFDSETKIATFEDVTVCGTDLSIVARELKKYNNKPKYVFCILMRGSAKKILRETHNLKLISLFTDKQVLQVAREEYLDKGIAKNGLTWKKYQEIQQEIKDSRDRIDYRLDELGNPKRINSLKDLMDIDPENPQGNKQLLEKEKNNPDNSPKHKSPSKPETTRLVKPCKTFPKSKWNINSTIVKDNTAIERPQPPFNYFAK